MKWKRLSFVEFQVGVGVRDGVDGFEHERLSLVSFVEGLSLMNFVDSLSLMSFVDSLSWPLTASKWLVVRGHVEIKVYLYGFSPQTLIDI